MNRLLLISFSIVVCFASPVLLAQQILQSEYVGQERRLIKSLSADDIIELRNGRGWGLAKAAELNGVPGPAHLLELKDDIPLTQEQVRIIKSIFDDMKSVATIHGEKLIELETRLEDGFSRGTITDEILRVSLDDIADTLSDLRYIHLSTHLRMRTILSNDQIDAYNSLRGYSQDPCAVIPSGHDPARWRKHNDCD